MTGVVVPQIVSGTGAQGQQAVAAQEDRQAQQRQQQAQQRQQQTPAQVQQPSPQGQQAQPQVQQAEPQIQVTPLPPPAPQRGAAPLRGQQAASILRKTITLRFRNRQAWHAVRLSDSDTLDTFEYCGNPEQARDGSYRLNCTPGSDGKIPLRIRGFKTVLIDGDETALDDKLEVVGYAAPYPRSWNRPHTELIAVGPARLRDVLGSRIPLSQGIEGSRACDAATEVSIADIVGGTIRFPEPPCRAYQVHFADIQLAADASILSNCLPGSNAPVRIERNQATCWRNVRDRGAIQIEAHLLRGFHPVRLPVPSDADGAERAEYSFEYVSAGLHAVWPYDERLIQDGEAPRYKVRSVQFTGTRGQACGGPVTPKPHNGRYVATPTLQEAGCDQVPRGMTVAFEQDSQAQGSAPAQAFKAVYHDSVPIDGSVGRQISLDSLKESLPVAFSREDIAAYNAQFGAPAGNTQFPGVYVFQNECSGTRNGKYVRFDARGGPYKWPIYAAVYDGKNEDPLTRCARAEVAPGPQPYLTFQLEGARAIGPRRAIVISSSRAFSSQSGMPRTLIEVLHAFVDQIHDTHQKKRAPLSPINVYLVNGQGNYIHVFAGEAAAFDPAKVKETITSTRESVAPNTPDFQALRFQPELKDFDRVTYVMDGSDVSQSNLDTLAGLVAQLNKTDPDNVSLVMTSNSCGQWQKLTQNFLCRTLPPSLAERRTALMETFAKFINPAGTQEAAQGTQAPAAESAGQQRRPNAQEQAPKRPSVNVGPPARSR
jgi:hypothetical protein